MKRDYNFTFSSLNSLHTKTKITNFVFICKRNKVILNTRES
jgi:hypothetical protein